MVVFMKENSIITNVMEKEPLSPGNHDHTPFIITYIPIFLVMEIHMKEIG